MISSHRAARSRPRTVATLVAASVGTLLLLAWAMFPSSAVAATTTTWAGNGSENLPCSGNEHWVLSPAQGITSAVLTLRGVDYTMVQNGKGSFAVDTNVGVNDGDIGNVTATYEGINDSAFLKLSHCDSGTTTTPTTTTKPPPTTTKTTTTKTETKTTTKTKTATVLASSAGFPGSGPGIVLAGLGSLLMLTLILRLASRRERE